MEKFLKKLDKKITFTKKELANMNLHKKEPRDKETEKEEKPEIGLKKKKERQ